MAYYKRSVIASQLLSGTNVEDLTAFFKIQGEIDYILIRNISSGSPVGEAFVMFKDE
jgi:hypothetical protein